MVQSVGQVRFMGVPADGSAKADLPPRTGFHMFAKSQPGSSVWGCVWILRFVHGSVPVTPKHRAVLVTAGICTQGSLRLTVSSRAHMRCGQAL